MNAKGDLPSRQKFVESTNSEMPKEICPKKRSPLEGLRGEEVPINCGPSRNAASALPNRLKRKSNLPEIWINFLPNKGRWHLEYNHGKEPPNHGTSQFAKGDMPSRANRETHM